MSTLIEKIIKFFLIVLFFSVPLVNSRLFNLFGIDYGFYVEGNYEFTKVMFFNIITGIIISLSFLKYIWDPDKLKINKKFLYIIFGLLTLIIISSLVSISPYDSVFGTSSKAHSLIMFTNLIGLYVILINIKKGFLHKLINISILSCFISIFIAIKEFFIPSFDYSDLSNRALGTFGHPNYLSLFLLLLTPSIYNILLKKKYFKIGKYLIGILFVGLLLTKSAWGIIIFSLYNLYYFKDKIHLSFTKRNISYGILGLIILLGIIIGFFPEKISSFISRFFIWQSTLDVIFASKKTLLLGSGFETLILVFDNFKSSYLYIFENIGFTADRPHNLVLNIFYHTGIFGILLFIYMIISFIKNYKNTVYFHSIILFFLFTIFNFASIASYLMVILFFAIERKVFRTKKIASKFFIPIFFIVLTAISFLGIIFSSKFYLAESYAYNNNHIKAKNIFPFNKNYYYITGQIEEGYEIEDFYSKQYYISKVSTFNNVENDCKNLVDNYPSIENYFFCGDILNKYGYNSIAKEYYSLGIIKLPDLWNIDSEYYNNFFIKNIVSGNRLLSPKYSNLKEILDSLGINITKDFD